MTLFLCFVFLGNKEHLLDSSHHLYRHHTLEQSTLSFLRSSGPLQVPDLLDQIVLFVTELLVLGSVRLEVAQELHQLGLVLQQDVQHRLGLVGVCDEHLRVEWVY